VHDGNYQEFKLNDVDDWTDAGRRLGRQGTDYSSLIGNLRVIEHQDYKPLSDQFIAGYNEATGLNLYANLDAEA
jgi:hypothetical protein